MLESNTDKLSRIMLNEFRRVHDRLDALDQRHDVQLTQSRTIVSEVGQIHHRLDALLDAVNNASGFAKEIDHLLNRIAAIEKHLGLNTSIKA